MITVSTAAVNRPFCYPYRRGNRTIIICVRRSYARRLNDSLSERMHHIIPPMFTTFKGSSLLLVFENNFLPGSA